MRVSLKWLRELVDLELTVPELCERLDMTGTKVEAVHAVGERLEGVVVGRVVAKEPHPDADKLSYCRVDVGGPEELRIVCGAQNFAEGDIVPVATIGTTLRGGVTIKRAKLRGVESEGMMCSAAELGVGGDQAGLLVLPSDAPVGMPFSEYYGTGDVVVELEVTPNRPDCLSVAGVAREVGAVLGTGARIPASSPVEAGTPAAEAVAVEIEDAGLCARYTARVIRGVKVGPSPEWLVERLATCGARAVNNVVDVTNYVMFELGQPLHAFDLATLGTAGGKAAILVRTARPGERLTTLDDVERALAEDTLLICDPSGPVALAGVMGGLATEVGDATVDVLLESASFAPRSVSRTSRRLGLISEASLRFERGVDPELAARASDRAAQLMAEVCGGEVAPGIVDTYPRSPEPLRLTLRPARTNAFLGTSISAGEMAGHLRRLGLSVEEAGEDLAVTVPTFRPDLVREVDLVEEVARLHGMEDIASTLPAGRGRIGGLDERQRGVRTVRETLRAAGLNEHVGFAFADPEDRERLGGWDLGPDELAVELLNPMSEEQAVMRWTLAGGLLRTVAGNQRRGVPDVHLFELGNVFRTAPGRKQPKERLMAGGVLAGRWRRPEWSDAPSAEDADRGPDLRFFDGKGVLEALMEGLDVVRWKVRAAERPWLQPGRAAEVVAGGDVVGWVGEVAPAVLDAYEARGPVVVFELAVAPLLKAVAPAKAYDEIPRLPAVTLDLALVVPAGVTAERVTQAISSAGGKLLESVRLFDVYAGPGVAEGSRSLAFALTYRAPDRTLTDEEVRGVHERLVRKVTSAVGGEVRG